MKKIIFVYIFPLLLIFTSAAVLAPASAQQALQDKITNRLEKTGGGIYGGKGKLEAGAFEKQVGGIINIALTLVGVIFLILTVYGGYIWMVARGDDAQAKKAKDIIIMATIGLAVVLAAYAVTNFVVTRLTGATAPGSPTSSQGK